MWLALNDLMQRHPNAIPIIARGGAYSPSAGEGTAGMVRLFKDAGLTPDEAAELLHILSACVVGFGFATLWGRQIAAAQEAAAKAVRTSPILRPRTPRPTRLRRTAAGSRRRPRRLPRGDRGAGTRRSSPRPSTSCSARTGTAPGTDACARAALDAGLSGGRPPTA